METLVKILDISSPAFEHNDYIPINYSCDGINVNPALTIHDIPSQTKSLALIVDDPDAPGGTYTHWIMWNMPPAEGLEENSAPGIQGVNDKGENKYYGPCPPSGIHHYYFKVYALDTMLDLPDSTDKKGLESAMEGHILAKGTIIGRYKKTSYV